MEPAGDRGFEALLDPPIEVRLGLPRVDWNRVWDAVERAGAELPGAEHVWQLAELWLRRLGAALSGDYSVCRTASFLLLAVPPDDEVPGLLAFAEMAHHRILEHLRGIVRTAAPFPVPLLRLGEWDDYYSYVADYYPEEGEFAASAGMFLRDALPHLVLPGRARAEQEPTLAHELTHAMLAHLPQPLWLNEGLAVSVERLLCGPGFSLTADVIGEHRSFWTGDTIQEFWSGRSFQRPDDGQRLSYHLAELLVRTLARDYEAFVSFANLARAADGGEAAACRLYGRSLGELPVGLLGPGRWGPRSGQLR